MKITGRTRLESGEQLIQTGNTYSGSRAVPQRSQVYLVYTINQEEQVDDFVEGYTYVHDKRGDLGQPIPASPKALFSRGNRLTCR